MLNRSLVLIKADKAQEQTEDGIYITEEWKQLPPTGTVEKVAPDVTFCKPGDRVEFKRYSAIHSSLGEDLRYCRESDLLQVL